MNNVLISFLAAASISTWFYAKSIRRTGGLHGSSITGSALIGVIVFIGVMIIMTLVDRQTGQ